jgi:hypothetical protein
MLSNAIAVKANTKHIARHSNITFLMAGFSPFEWRPKPLAAIPIAAQQELNYPTGRRLPALYHGKIHQLSAASAKFRSASKTLTRSTNISTRPFPETIFFRGWPCKTNALLT